mgnify:CR=1 FL=1
MDRFDMLALALALALGSEKRHQKETKTGETTTEDTIEVLDRDITLGIRERVCDENSCGLTHCPLYVDDMCVGNHHCTGIKVKIPARIIDAEAEDRKSEV